MPKLCTNKQTKSETSGRIYWMSVTCMERMNHCQGAISIQVNSTPSLKTDTLSILSCFDHWDRIVCTMIMLEQWPRKDSDCQIARKISFWRFDNCDHWRKQWPMRFAKCGNAEFSDWNLSNNSLIIPGLTTLFSSSDCHQAVNTHTTPKVAMCSTKSARVSRGNSIRHWDFSNFKHTILGALQAMTCYLG